MDKIDQAEGLRRILCGAKPRFITFLSALSNEEKNATVVNLSAGLGQLGNEVLLLDMRSNAVNQPSVINWLEAGISSTLVDVAKQKTSIEQAIQVTTQGFKLVSFCRDPHTNVVFEPTKSLLIKLNKLVEELGKGVDIVLVDGELSDLHGLTTEILNDGEIVILVTNHPDSIKSAYSLIKRAHGKLGRRSYGILVTGVNEEEAQRVYDVIAQVAGNFLSVPLCFMGYVPQDDYLRRASMSGITVLDAFPKAVASRAFARLAQQLLHTNEVALSD